MTFNDSGKSPWDKNKQPNVDQFLSELQKMFKQGSGFFKGWIVLGIVVVVWLASGVYRVEPGEQGVVRRFGKMTVIKQPGIHFHLPWPMEERNVVKVEQIRKMELGFRMGSQGSSRIPRAIPAESLMITGDENLVNIMVVLQYRISDLPAYLFKVWDPEGSPDGRTLRDAAETALRGVVGGMNIDEILTVGRAKVQVETKARLQSLMDNYETGLLITEVKLQAVEPPEPVDAAFKDVVSAKEDRERIINEAQAYREDLLPKARGQAEEMLRTAEGYKEARIREAQGDSSRFLALLKEYRLAKEVTRSRLYLETMEAVLQNIEKVIISKKLGDRSLPLLPLTGLGQGSPGASRQERKKQ